MIKTSLNQPLLKKLIVLATGLFVTAFFFRIQLLSHGQQLFSDFYDGLIAFSIIHHWYNFFHGLEPWRTAGYFFPYPGTLGYNDGYFLYGVIYSAFRFITTQVFSALELTNALIRLIGFYSFFYLCHRQLKLKFWICLLTATLFTLSNAVYEQSVHAQIFSISFAPLLTVFLLNYVQQLFIYRSTQKAIFWGSLAGIFYASWLLSTYYMAWFYAFFACIWLGFTIVLQIQHQQFFLKKPPILAIVIPLLVTLLSLLPFLMTYLPTAQQTGMHIYGEALYYMPRLLDLLNVGNQNLLWGKLISYLDLRDGEFSVGFPLVFLIVLILALKTSIKETGRAAITLYRPLSYAILLSIIVSLILFKSSLWLLIWHAFPGAKGLRTVCRLWIFLVFPMCILLTYYLSEKMNWRASLFASLLPFLLILEQINLAHVTNLSGKSEQDFFNAAKNIPSQCQTFFVIGTRHEENHSMGKIINNVDAMVIAETIHIKTINGTSTFAPPDWDFNYFPKETYLNRMKTYENNHHIKNLCSLDLTDMKWQISL